MQQKLNNTLIELEKCKQRESSEVEYRKKLEKSVKVYWKEEKEREA